MQEKNEMVLKKHISTCKIWQTVSHDIKDKEKGPRILKRILTSKKHNFLTI